MNGDQKHDYYKYELEIREADVVEFMRPQSIFNGETYRGYLILKNHVQIDKISNVVSDFVLEIHCRHCVIDWDSKNVVQKNFKQKT